MKFALFLAYLVVEAAVFVGLVYAIGFWWTLLATLAALVLGMVLLRRTGVRVLGELRVAAEGRGDSLRPLTDTALLGLSAVLLVVPGIVSTVVGIALLLTPVRAAARPLVAAVGARRVVLSMNRMAPRGPMGPRPRPGTTVVDGEVIDEPPEHRRPLR